MLPENAFSLSNHCINKKGKERGQSRSAGRAQLNRRRLAVEIRPGRPTLDQIWAKQQSQAPHSGRMNGPCCRPRAWGITLFNTPGVSLRWSIRDQDLILSTQQLTSAWRQTEWMEKEWKWRRNVEGFRFRLLYCMQVAACHTPLCHPVFPFSYFYYKIFCITSWSTKKQNGNKRQGLSAANIKYLHDFDSFCCHLVIKKNKSKWFLLTLYCGAPVNLPVAVY